MESLWQTFTNNWWKEYFYLAQQQQSRCPFVQRFNGELLVRITGDSTGEDGGLSSEIPINPWIEKYLSSA